MYCWSEFAIVAAFTDEDAAKYNCGTTIVSGREISVSNADG